MYKRYALAALVLLPLLLPLQADAAIDQRCWSRLDCEGARISAGASDAEAGEGFYTGPDAKSVCPDRQAGNQTIEMGFCSPVGRANTGVTFGTKNEFAHLGEFILYMYRYGVIVASVLAVLVIIFAGLRWLTSGGNSATIDSAKKQLAGSLTGLALALLSYTILYTINPQLVTLRLPQVWMINTVSTPVEYCHAVPDGSRVAEVPLIAADASDEFKEGLYSRASFTIDPKQAKCGMDYFIEGANAATCEGSACAKRQVCKTPDGEDSNGQPLRPKCESGMLSGKVEAPAALLCGDLKSMIINDTLGLLAICGSGDIQLIDYVELDEGARSYIFRYDDDIHSPCTDEGGTIGFYLGAEINDEGGGFFGEACPGNPIAAGVDDWHAIGKATANSNECNFNLGKLASSIAFGSVDCDGENGQYNCSCGFLSREDRMKDVLQNPDFKAHLITTRELDNGFICNITVNRKTFPAFDNADNIRDATNCYYHQWPPPPDMGLADS